MATRIKKSIIINHYNDLYEIPDPKELTGISYVLHYNTNLNSKNIHIDTSKNTKIETKQFFAYNPEIFKLYLEKIINMEIMPDNFYMFIDQILYLIKSKNIIEIVDDYWKNMILQREKK
jgi:hypothetical protein